MTLPTAAQVPDLGAGTAEPRVIATFSDYNGFLDALRKRATD
jgi:hypothetical protein